MTKNIIQRLLVFILGVPLFISLVVYASFGRNVILALLVVAIQILCAGETSALFAVKKIKVNKTYITILSVSAALILYLSPVLSGLFPSRPSSLEMLIAVTMLGSLASIAPFAFSKAATFDAILPELAASLFVFFYCGILGSFLMYIATCFGQLAEPVFTFTLMTFGNDSLAWLVGMTLGKKRGIVAVSPSKSAVGFIGGFAGSIIASLLAYLIFPRSGFGQPVAILFLGLLMGVSVILGDLVESALKRSAGVKDSSALVPGRGGFLDSFDSLLFSAPIFALFSAFQGFFAPLA
ncbi:MAG: phosphatidate cytidylyltransferase [Rectinemataceae bacterium]